MIKICFICHGNICRSPMAEFIMKYLLKENNLLDKVEVTSRATSKEALGEELYYKSRNKLIEKKIPLEEHVSRQITEKEIKENDLLIVMDERNINNLKPFMDISSPKLRKLLETDIKDPWYTENFEEAYNDIYKGCINLLEEIKLKIKDE